MDSRPADSQHPPNLGVGFVQVPADDFEPFNGQGTLPLESRFGLHSPADINCFLPGIQALFHRALWCSVAESRQTPKAGAIFRQDEQDSGKKIPKILSERQHGNNRWPDIPAPARSVWATNNLDGKDF
jgi:hypothetical protein